MSYTAIVYLHSTHTDYRIVVQFRSEKQDLSAVAEASRIYGHIVPMVTYQGIVLMSSEDFELPLWKKMTTVLDLADLVTRGARANKDIFDTTIVELASTLEKIQHTINNYTFRNTSLKNIISAYISKVLPQLRDLVVLPITLTHQDLAPFNYLIDPSTGRIKAVLDWDGAVYLPVGSNFHFVDSLLGFMTPKGWQDTEDRHDLEAAFYDRALCSLAAQGHKNVTKEQLESQKAI
ncbi:hypothetical protein N7540_011073 [Penicillium herquei]|nr:hypothetical protein N7540_011073 [Penicillium herquei]